MKQVKCDPDKFKTRSDFSSAPKWSEVKKEDARFKEKPLKGWYVSIERE